MENFSQGQLIYNRYLLKELVGRGGFSEVWRAIDQMTQETVALKIFNNSEGVEEYKQTLELKHPNILTPKFIGLHNPNAPFLVLPFCDQGTTQAKIGKLDQEELARLIFQIADALSFVHERSIIHNDVKPDNFLISSDLNKSKYFLSDFGISDQRNSYKTQNLSSQAAKQEPRGIIPTPYRAPELIDHEGNHTDKKAVLNTDIWAFGASIYELAVGRQPFGNQGGLAQIMARNQGKHEVENILTEWPAQVSASLFDLVKRCLDYTPWKRPDAAELRDTAKLFLEKGIWNPKEKPKPKPIKPETPKTPIDMGNNKSNATPGFKEPLPPKPKSKFPAWIIVLGALIILALLSMCSISASKYKELLKEGDTLLANRDTAAALVKYKEAVGINLYATAELKGKIDSLEHPVQLVKDKNGQDKDSDLVDDPRPNPPARKTDPKPEKVRVEEGETLIEKPEPPKSSKELLNVSFTASEDQVYVGHSIVFTDNTTFPSGFKRKNYEWDFGDGTKQKNPKPQEISHTYTKPGRYTVKLCYNNDNALICNEQSKVIEVIEEGGSESPDGADKIGVHATDRSKCTEEKFESGTFSLVIRPKSKIDLKGMSVIANAGGTITISLIEGGSTLEKFTKRIAQNSSGTPISLNAFSDLYPGKTYTLQVQTQEGVRLQNLATCSPDNSYNTSSHVAIEYIDDHYVIFDLKYEYYLKQH